LPARTAAPRLAPRNPHHPLQPSAQQATSFMHDRRSQPPAHNAAAADARSVPLRPSSVSRVILARLGASDAAPSSPIELSARTAAPSARPVASLTTRCNPAHNRPSPKHTTPSAHRRRSQPPAHSAAGRRCTQRTIELQHRQPRHPSETRCKRRCPIISDRIVCTHRRPSARPVASLTTRCNSAQPPQPTACNIIRAQPAFAATRSQRSCRRCKQLTSESQLRQLLHPGETR
jgi:hypothetical protein